MGRNKPRPRCYELFSFGVTQVLVLFGMTLVAAQHVSTRRRLPTRPRAVSFGKVKSLEYFGDLPTEEVDPDFLIERTESLGETVDGESQRAFLLRYPDQEYSEIASINSRKAADDLDRLEADLAQQELEEKRDQNLEEFLAKSPRKKRLKRRKRSKSGRTSTFSCCIL